MSEDLTYRYWGPHGDCTIAESHTHPATVLARPKTLWGGLTLDDVAYDVRVYPPDHGAFHNHAADNQGLRHEDGSDGTTDHHHHNRRCVRRAALLIPVPPGPREVLPE